MNFALGGGGVVAGWALDEARAVKAEQEAVFVEEIEADEAGAMEKVKGAG